MNDTLLKKYFQWEYWPSYMFYLPVIPYAIYLAIKARNLVFFSATNPGIIHSGNGSESKYKTIQLIPQKYRPLTLFFAKGELNKEILDKLNSSSINYPLICKPDIGFRGLLVKKINSEEDLINYLTKNKEIDLIIQEFIPFSKECGIFYHRLPNEPNGKITSITLKKYLTVTGDGDSTLLELISKDKRAKKYEFILKELLFNDLHFILPKNESRVLSEIGNHSKGTQFINGNELICPKLEEIIDSIFHQIPKVYYGRLDIKYNSFELIEKGKDFKILEINGIISEPTHIYDSEKGSYWMAIKEIKKHWKIVYRISTINNKHFKHAYDKPFVFIKSLIKIRKHIKMVQKSILTT
ncbi:D-alanine--D-alanine ligase [Lutibacter sp.]|uniref:D-alanine--D-alanine ligase n=1 Tax=Lutibacter sp. TaxID=1925666 RepID=UPI00273437DC|nr:D-alanine--D-alanine ligase [Lutibacter sp.]MDP3314209.1 D-alanine--D-alanine ligase [Lutibacter sp.]